MKFDGVVGDMGSDLRSYVMYEMALSGVDVEGMKRELRRIARRKRVEALNFLPVVGVEGGRYRVGLMVRSERGIV